MRRVKSYGEAHKKSLLGVLLILWQGERRCLDTDTREAARNAGDRQDREKRQGSSHRPVFYTPRSVAQPGVDAKEEGDIANDTSGR